MKDERENESDGRTYIRDDGGVFRHEKPPEDMKEMMETILKNEEGLEVNFVLIRAVEEKSGMSRIQLMTTLDMEDRINLIFTQLRRDLGKEKWRDTVRKLAVFELVDIAVGDSAIQDGN